MAQEAEMRRAARTFAKVFRDYADRKGWQTADYRVFARLDPEWGNADLVLAARSFGKSDLASSWEDVKTFLDSRLGEMLNHYPFIHVGLRTFDQINGGGVYGLTDDYGDIDEVLASGPVA